MIDLGKFNLLGVRIDAVDYEAAIKRINLAAKQRQPYGVSALAVHGVMTGALDSTQRYRLNNLEMVVPDGQPVRWGLNLLHRVKLKDRVYGPNLMLEICQNAAEQGLSIFLFGGKQELLEQLENQLLLRFPISKLRENLHPNFARSMVKKNSRSLSRLRRVVLRSRLSDLVVRDKKYGPMNSKTN